MIDSIIWHKATPQLLGIVGNPVVLGASVTFAAFVFTVFHHVRPPSSAETRRKDGITGAVLATLASMFFFVGASHVSQTGAEVNNIKASIESLKATQAGVLADNVKFLSDVRPLLERMASEHSEAACARLYLTYLHTVYSDRFTTLQTEIRREFKWPPKNETEIPDAMRAVNEHRAFFNKALSSFYEEINMGRRVFKALGCAALFQYTEDSVNRHKNSIHHEFEDSPKTVGGLTVLHENLLRELASFCEELNKGLPKNER